LLAFYRSPPPPPGRQRGPELRLSRRELQLTLAAALTWSLYNAGYIAFLTFAPLVLEAGGRSELAAAGIVSIASWAMMFSGALCGQLADRSKRPDLILTLCMLTAVAALALLAVEGADIAASLLFGAVGMAPAGIILALTGAAMAPERRAFGMGIFLSLYFCFNALAPPLAGWIYDRTHDPFDPLRLAALLFGAVILSNLCFRRLQRRPLVTLSDGRGSRSSNRPTG
jgi:predicted MFS family arabinose efflux permease